MDIIKKIAEELAVRNQQVEAAVRLLDEGNTVPFIARYRKEVTGMLDDAQLRTLSERLTYLRGLEDKKAQVLGEIESQGKLTEDLHRKIEEAETLVVVDDLYRPYRPKRRTRASVAKEKGLQGLADYILLQEATAPVDEAAKAYVTVGREDISEDKWVLSVEEAIQGAEDILAEMMADDAEVRAEIREMTWEEGTLVSAAKESKADKKAEKKADKQAEIGGKISGGKEEVINKKLEERRQVYEMYYDFEEPLKKLPGHRVLAINRGENEKFLNVKITAPEEVIISRMLARYLKLQVSSKKTGRGFDAISRNPYTTPLMEATAGDAYARLIAPAIERELRSRLTEMAEDGAIRVFKENLKQLLLQPPLTGQTVLGWDPAFRTGCKLAVVDATGKVLATKVIHPTAPQNRVAEAEAELTKLIDDYQVTVFSVGNGTASRESEQIIVDYFKKLSQDSKHKTIAAKLGYVIVNEAGASVYSASKQAEEEFPTFDVGQRSAVSIARRLQDPLAELVKIDPKGIGVGQYQHDIDQKKLGEALSGVVEDCVNKVGVDLNTASYSLLSYISGISTALAKNIVAWREENGRFNDRRDLLKVKKLGPKAFEQCAGFLRIFGGNDILDSTSVHPETYGAVRELLRELGLAADSASLSMVRGLVKNKKAVAARIGIGEMTLDDILKELDKPGRDIREDMPKPILRSDVLSMDDLTEGMVLKGTVRNIVDFGAFVDIGVHQDGLVHISRMSKKFIKHPLEAVSVGDIVEVKVISVDKARKRIGLSMTD